MITHFVWYLDKEIRSDNENLSIGRVFNKNSHCTQEILLKMRHFEKGLSKSLKKVKFIFSFESSPF